MARGRHVGDIKERASSTKPQQFARGVARAGSKVWRALVTSSSNFGL